MGFFLAHLAKRAFLVYNLWRCCLACFIFVVYHRTAHGARRTAHGARRTAETFGQTAFVVLAVILGGFCTLAFADKASAQQLPPSSISYTTEPAGLITITADGEVIVLSQPAAGAMTVTISGIGFTLVGGEYVRTGYTGQDTLTLRFLTSCSIRDGCDAFGLQASSRPDRIAAFRAMDLTTLRMFIATGADLNETVDSTAARHLLLYYLANTDFPVGTPHPQLAKMSLMVSAGADVNRRAQNEFVMLHVAAVGDDGLLRPLEALLAMDGISVNLINANGETPLDRLASFYEVVGPDARLEENARTLRQAGGRCISRTNTTICGVSQQSPNISLPNNANKTFIIRGGNLNTPGVIGNLSTPPGQ